MEKRLIAVFLALSLLGACSFNEAESSQNIAVTNSATNTIEITTGTKVSTQTETNEQFSDFSDYEKGIISELSNFELNLEKSLFGVKISETEDSSVGELDFIGKYGLFTGKYSRGIIFSQGKYALVNSDFYKDTCAKLLIAIGAALNLEKAENTIDDIISTYNETEKMSSVVDIGGYRCFLYYADYENSAPKFKFFAHEVSFLTDKSEELKGGYSSLTKKMYDTPSMYSGSKIYLSGIAESTEDENSEMYAIGKKITFIDSNGDSYDAEYDYAYYPFDYAEGNSYTIYGELSEGKIVIDFCA